MSAPIKEVTQVHSAIFSALKQSNVFTLLQEQGYISDDSDSWEVLIKDQKQLYEILHEALEKGEIILDEVLDLPFLDQESFYTFIAAKKEMHYINLGKMDLHLEIDEQITTSFLQEKLVVPLKTSSLSVEVGMYNPYDQSVVYELMKLLGKNIVPSLVRKDQLQKHIYEVIINRDLESIIAQIKIDLSKPSEAEQSDIKEQSNTVKMLELILNKGVKSRASDIHFEFDKAIKKAVIRFRIDGLLYERFEFDENIYSALSSTLKLITNIDFVNNTKAQDGRFSYRIDEQKFDFRVSVIPLFNGESISVRILQKKNSLVSLEELELSKSSFAVLRRVSHAPHGLILVTGPTGSGKTTTLYSMLSSINNNHKKIITVEDPVEYQLLKVQQIQVKIRSDINFTTILKSILRHDPDVIMIGEVRDGDSLKVAVESALTGHLVFTTLHTNDAISSIVRLKEMGVEDYLVANALSAVHSQRLVRKLCQGCKKEHIPNEQIMGRINPHLAKLKGQYRFFYSQGCNECSMTGFVGRTVISETIFVDQELSSILTQSMDYERIYELLAKKGFVSILDDGISKAIRGETSLDEVLKSVYS